MLAVVVTLTSQLLSGVEMRALALRVSLHRLLELSVLKRKLQVRRPPRERMLDMLSLSSLVGLIVPAILAWKVAVVIDRKADSLGLGKGKQKAEELYTALGADRVLHGGMIPATHNMGVARIGEDPTTSVCNPWGQTHDIDNLFVSDGSLFPTSGCANPTLTIIALVLRQANYIEAEVNAGSI